MRQWDEFPRRCLTLRLFRNNVSVDYFFLTRQEASQFLHKPLRQFCTTNLLCLEVSKIDRRIVVLRHYLLRDGDGNVIDWQPPLQEEVLPHVREGGGRIDRVSPYPVALQVWGSIAAL